MDRVVAADDQLDCGGMTDAARSPFAKFPWPQAAFCGVCLAMTTTTWTMYSYAWAVTPEDLAAEDGTFWPGQYVLLTGTVKDWAPDTLFDVVRGESGAAVLVMRIGKSILLPGECTVRGRLTNEFGEADQQGNIIFDPRNVEHTEGRLTGASIAGIVVGAMGCFVFGLYLRRWLRERRAIRATELTGSRAA